MQVGFPINNYHTNQMLHPFVYETIPIAFTEIIFKRTSIRVYKSEFHIICC